MSYNKIQLRKWVPGSPADHKRWLSLFPNGILSDVFKTTLNSGVFFSVLITVYFYLQKSQSKAKNVFISYMVNCLNLYNNSLPRIELSFHFSNSWWNIRH